MPDEPKAESKIIVDEDWKSQIEAEKAAACGCGGHDSEAAAEPGSCAEPGPCAESGPAEPLPPPSLTMLSGSLYLQGMISLGMLPPPNSDQPEVDLDHAKYAIDSIAMLQEKTEGNRTEQETSELERMLHEMRMVYVSVQEEQPGKTAE
ncbi:MAG: DUF1844 domain-containing protein [Candidatus Nealsonbacteria bacterium]|nr:DUF1844 domain-containing protein [Candidatus Nealsonbacteria bacterium]